jgi:uncharacterized membrane protein
MSLESSKTLGGVGAILLAIPFLNIVGIILVLISMKGLADYYDDNDIFQNALYGFLFGIIGVFALIAVIVLVVLGFAVIAPAPVVAPLAGIGLVIIVAVVMYVFSLLGAIFYKKALDRLAVKSSEKMFETAGLLLLIGAAIPLIGEILKLVAWILAAVGFFSIRMPTHVPTVPPVAPAPQVAPPTVPAAQEKRFCQYCGAANNLDASFCQRCGKRIG